MVMSNGWTNQKGRSLLNFLVSCPRGIMFIRYVDASAHIKDVALLCELLDGFIQEIGPQNIVQVIMDNTTNYVATSRLLMKRLRPCFGLPVLHIASI